MASCALESAPRAPRLAPNQPNGISALASAMVAMDSQLQATLTSVMADPTIHGKADGSWNTICWDSIPRTTA